jgi:hypothetical protein
MTVDVEESLEFVSAIVQAGMAITLIVFALFMLY